MRYTKPEVATLATANVAIQNSEIGKPLYDQVDSRTGELTAQFPAYEADE